ncbi:MAG: ParB N-terminal domain-containing protein [Candidatus Velamenicoccus archaeovorus]
MSDQIAVGRSTFGRARRREAYRRLAGIVRRRRPRRELLDLDDVRRRLRVFEQSYVGVRPIPADRIVGTLGRAADFDRGFLPRRPEIRQRWERVERTFSDGGVPPISVYELDGSYFVVDGHHRVAVARQQGVEYVDAEITRLRARRPLPPDADIPALIMAEQQLIFFEESGLDRARPEARIRFTRPQGYIELLEQVKIHGYHLMMEHGRVLSKEEIAGDWYDRVYLPTVEAIEREGLRGLCREPTKADLFLWVSQRRRELFPERGGMDTEQAVRAVREFDRRESPVRARIARRFTGETVRFGDTGEVR